VAQSTEGTSGSIQRWDYDKENKSISNKFPLKDSASSETVSTQPFKPDSSKLVITVNDSGQKVRTLNIDGTNESANLSTRSNQRSPSWNPNISETLKVLVFSAIGDVGGDTDIIITDESGGNEIVFEVNSSSEVDPCWSQDGLNIAYWYSDGGFRRIFTNNNSGTNEEAITADDKNADTPFWGLLKQ